MRSRLANSAAFLHGMHRFLRHRLTVEQARTIIQERLDHREDNFLRMVETKIYGHAQSPYLPLLRMARCEFGDIATLIRTKGLENTLEHLRQAGVYVTFEEFKGRTPVRRGALEYAVTPEDFDSPGLGPAFTTSTSGSTGRGVRVTLSLDQIASDAVYLRLYADALGCAGSTHVLWMQAFPGFLGPKFLLRSARAGFRKILLLDPGILRPKNLSDSFKQTVLRKAFYLALHRHGHAYPHPEPAPIDHPEQIARRVANILRDEGSCLVRAYVNMGLRVCLAAAEKGLDLQRATFECGGEPVTPAKMRTFEAAGVRFVSTYSSSDTGFIGKACLASDTPNDIHFFKDTLALIQWRRETPLATGEVDAFYFTTLMPWAPKTMLNVESDDYGRVQETSCGCPLHEFGLTTHLTDIQSFGKLTGMGVTLVGSDALWILEEVLPGLFGGSPIDYQLSEEEDAEGRTVIRLYVSPGVNIPREERVKSAFLDALEGWDVANPFAAAQWRKTGAFEVVREDPRFVGQGKLLPLRVRRN